MVNTTGDHTLSRNIFIFFFFGIFSAFNLVVLKGKREFSTSRISNTERSAKPYWEEGAVFKGLHFLPSIARRLN